MSPVQFYKIVFSWPSVICVSLGTIISIAAGSLYKIRQLSHGGTIVAEFLGGRRITASTKDDDERRLRNIVEEMAIASGMSVPEIYILDAERGINAFAAGHTHDDVAIGVTRGAVKLLKRDELQGIVAHEFSHILNGDTRLNMKLIGLAHGLFWPTLVGRVLIYGSMEKPSMNRSAFLEEDKVPFLPTAPLGILFVILGCISLPFVRLVKSAICRQREVLADAAAVQFTRNPPAIAGALTKIGGLPKQGRLDTPQAEVASHLYFSSCRYKPWLEVLSTHPPLEKRITAVYPYFDGIFPPVKMLPPNQAERDQAFYNTVSGVMASQPLSTDDILAGNCGITVEQIRQASLIRLGLPDELKSAVRTSSGAANIIFALLFSDDTSVRAQQLEILSGALTASALEEFNTLAPLVETLEVRFRLPLAEFAVPALRENDLAANTSFQQTLQQLVECDGSIGLFEYALMKMVARRLRAHFSGPASFGVRGGLASDVAAECTLLLSALAYVGGKDEAEARKMFAQGATFLNTGGTQLFFLTRDQWDLSKVDAALTQLANYHEPLRRNILLASGKTVIANLHVNDREAELLRAIADSLDCPVPSFVEAIRSEELTRES